MSYPSKNTSTYTSPSKNTSTSTLPDFSSLFFLLKEDGDYLLQENSDKFILDSVGLWNYQLKS